MHAARCAAIKILHLASQTPSNDSVAFSSTTALKLYNRSELKYEQCFDGSYISQQHATFHYASDKIWSVLVLLVHNIMLAPV